MRSLWKVMWDDQGNQSIRQLFLRSYLKKKFKHCHRSTGTKRSDTWEVNAIHPHICNGTILNFRNRLQTNIDADGHHLGDIIHYSSNMMNLKWFVLINSNIKSGLLHIFPFSYCGSLCCTFYNRNVLQKHNPRTIKSKCTRVYSSSSLQTHSTLDLPLRKKTPRWRG